MKTKSYNLTHVAFGGLIALAAAMGIGRFVYTPILPFMIESLSLTETAAGIIASANFFGYLLGALFAASSKLPGEQRSWLIVALVISALTTGAMGLTTSISIFLGLRFIGGIASAFVLVFGSALVLDRFENAGRPGLSAIHFAGVGCGIAISAILVSSLAAGGYDWWVQWVCSGIISLIALGAVLWLVPSKSAATPATSSEIGGQFDRRLPPLIVAYGLFGFGYVITATFISTIVRTSPQVQSIEPLIWLVVGLAAIPSVALWTGIGQRFGNAYAFAMACLVEGAGVAMSVLATNTLGIIIAAALLGGTFMGITALGLIYARQLSAGEPRRSLALMTASFGLGQMIGPSFAGMVYTINNSFLLPSLVASAALVAAACLVMGYKISGVRHL